MSRNRRRSGRGDSTRRRAAVVGALVLTLFAVAGARSVHLQVVAAPGLQTRAEEQRFRRLELLPARGTIYDRNGRELAKSVAGASVFVDPSVLADDPGGVLSLCRALDLEPGQARDVMARGGSRFAWLARGITPSQEQAVEALGLAGVGIASEPQRYYPKKSLAGQVLGFVGVDGEGLGGLEYRYDAVLRGRARELKAERDAKGRLLLTGAPDPSGARGKSLVLTIDETVQHIAEEELLRAVEESRARAGVAIVMEPSTGEILALAHAPSFNPNAFQSSTPEQRKIRSAVDVFEPGSTLKAVFVGMLLDRKLAGTSELVFCEEGSWRIHGRTIHDHNPHGWLTVADVLKVSSNIGVAKLSQKLSPEALREGLLRFGLGEPTGVELPGESRGILPPTNQWSKITPMTVVYGQGVSTTAVQVITAFAALANEGQRMRPHLVRAVLDEEGRTIERTEPQAAGEALSPAAARDLVPLLEAVVHAKDGTAPKAAVPGYRVAGKTGTAWKPDPETGGYRRDKVVASFAGFAPSRAPRIAVLVAVDEPTKGSRYGGMVAGPAFREIARRVLSYLQVPPEAGAVASEGAAAPERPARASASEAAPGTMPDVRGLTMRDVLRQFERTGVAVAPSLLGSGVASSQDPSPGASLSPGQTCRVVFRPLL